MDAILSRQLVVIGNDLVIVPPLFGVWSVHEGSFEPTNDNILELVWRQLKGIAAKPQLPEHVGLAHGAVVGTDRDCHMMVEHVLQRVVQQIPLELWNYLSGILHMTPHHSFPFKAFLRPNFVLKKAFL